MRRTDNDPLQSFDGDNVNLDDVVGENGVESSSPRDDDDGFDDPIEGDGEETAKNVTNKSTAGRVKWQEKHKKGKYSKTYQKKQKGLLGF